MTMTALLRAVALLTPGCEYNYLLIFAPSDFDRLVSEYRLV